jgi:cell division protein FtsA
LAGLVYYAASDPIDLRAHVSPQQTVHRPKGLAAFQRFMSAVRTNY